MSIEWFFLNLFFLLAEISEYLLDMEDGSTVSFFSIVFIIRGNFQGRNLAWKSFVCGKHGSNES